ncbi:MAG: hypothetical protein JWO03_730 [Bacteroidetes bacterium]|nr:hypothetical protein [Bacteroidota bacterium]
MRKLSILASVVILLAACGNKNPEKEVTVTIAGPSAPSVKYQIIADSIQHITLPSDASQSYELYYPKTMNRNISSRQVIVLFDPHGSGRLPLEKYRKLADEFGIAVAGSNNSKNGIDVNLSTRYANNIINDLSSRMGFAVKNICLAGFSGGAKVALSTCANNLNSNNVIYSGAANSFNPSHPVHVLGFAGTADMNYSDLLQFAGERSKADPKGSQLVEFEGKHEWPDVQTYRKAFYWLRFQQARIGGQKDSALVTRFMHEEDKIIGADEKKVALTDAYQECVTASAFLDGIADAGIYQSKMTTIAANPAYHKQQEKKYEVLANETSQKQMLMAAFQKEDGNWWAKTINGYRASPAPSDKRLLGFISLGCYSYSSQLLERGDLANAAHFLAIYELADPDNMDQLYFHAMLYAKQNDRDKAISYLTKAVVKGYNDGDKMAAQPEFTPLQADERFSRLLTSLKKGSK